MLRKEGDKVYAVLNDFDLAVSADVKSTSSKQRTGTKPFMVIDPLRPDPPVHMYRHDLESMFYVLIWTTSCFHNGYEIPLPPLQEWADNDGVTVTEKKSFFCYDVRTSSANTAI
jgi:Fungal protein kinase